MWTWDLGPFEIWLYSPKWWRWPWFHGAVPKHPRRPFAKWGFSVSFFEVTCWNRALLRRSYDG